MREWARTHQAYASFMGGLIGGVIFGQVLRFARGEPLQLWSPDWRVNVFWFMVSFVIAFGALVWDAMMEA